MEIKKPHLPPEDMPVMMLVNEISKLFFDIMRHESESIGLQSGYRHLLFHLSRQDGITQFDLARLTHLKAPTVSVSLHKMESSGLITRKTDSSDLRQTRVFLTEKGKKLDMRMRDKIAETEAIVMNGISNDEEKLIKQLLIKMRKNILDESRCYVENECD